MWSREVIYEVEQLAIQQIQSFLNIMMATDVGIPIYENSRVIRLYYYNAFR